MIFSALKAGLVLFAFSGLIFGFMVPYEKADAAKALNVKTFVFAPYFKGIVCVDKLCSEKYTSQ